MGRYKFLDTEHGFTNKTVFDSRHSLEFFKEMYKKYKKQGAKYGYSFGAFQLWLKEKYNITIEEIKVDGEIGY